MAQPNDRRYTKTHEWVKTAGTEATVGITQYAQEQLGDVVFVELPAAGKKVDRGGALGNIESVKAVSEVFAPLGGTVSAVNGELEGHPELVNQDPYGAGWLVKLTVAPGAPEGLMDAAAYESFLAEEGAH
ncbi:MAG TPA: glycine cleavage system protein GcvH [Thermoanaerobaculaceae bacterium]|nr:glycine cleavage system protein GcvH [Thermoanaerobaculaceae bacterium]